MRRLILALLIFAPCLAWGAISSGTFTIGPGQNFPEIHDFASNLSAELIGDVTGYINANYCDPGGSNFIAITAPDKQIYLRVNPMFRHGAVFDVTKSSAQVSGGFAYVSSGNITFDGFQIFTTANASAVFCNTSVSTMTVMNTIIKGDNTTANQWCFLVGGTGNVCYLKNVLMYNFNPTLSSSRPIFVNWSNGLMYSNHVTICNSYYAWRANGGTFYYYNCLVADTTAGGFAGGSGGDYNVQEYNSTPVGAHSKGNTPITFVDQANGDYRLAATESDVIDFGYVTGNPMIDVSEDIAGNIRPNGVAPDAGAFEYYVTGGIPIIATDQYMETQGTIFQDEY